MTLFEADPPPDAPETAPEPVAAPSPQRGNPSPWQGREPWGGGLHVPETCEVCGPVVRSAAFARGQAEAGSDAETGTTRR